SPAPGTPAIPPTSRARARSRDVTFRIHQFVQRDATVFALSGVLDGEHAARLQELLATVTPGPVVLDLKDITLVDRTAVGLLARFELAGAKIVNCPEYVRSWITAESDNR